MFKLQLKMIFFFLFAVSDGASARLARQALLCHDGECLCCFEVSNDRQIAARANGSGQPGTIGVQRRGAQLQLWWHCGAAAAAAAAADE